MAVPDEPVRGDRDVVVKVVRSAFARALEAPEAELDPAGPLADLPGMESVRFLRAVAVLEEQLGVVIPDEALYGIGTLDELADWVLGEGRR